MTERETWLAVARAMAWAQVLLAGAAISMAVVFGGMGWAYRAGGAVASAAAWFAIGLAIVVAVVKLRAWFWPALKDQSVPPHLRALVLLLVGLIVVWGVPGMILYLGAFMGYPPLF